MTGLILDILFPSRCAGCGGPAASRDHGLCPECAGRIAVPENACPRCAAPLDGARCPSCADRHWYISQSITVAAYDGVMKRAIRAMKFRRVRAIHRVLGSLALDALGRRTVTADIITWVPMSRKKRWDRGFNQSELISAFISKRTGIPARPLLKERPGIRAQRRLGLRDRFINTLGRYEAVRGADLSGKKVMIIDDVCTTGATINECARQLRLGGADQVFSLTIARTDIKRLEKF